MLVPRHLAHSLSLGLYLWKVRAAWIGEQFWYRKVCRESSPGQIFYHCGRLGRVSPCVPAKAKETGDRIGYVKRRQGFLDLFKTFKFMPLSDLRKPGPLIACLQGAGYKVAKQADGW